MGIWAGGENRETDDFIVPFVQSTQCELARGLRASPRLLHAGQYAVRVVEIWIPNRAGAPLDGHPTTAFGHKGKNLGRVLSANTTLQG